MNALVEEWMRKGNGDFATARRELSAVDLPNYDAVCFHAQQCIEKLMKGLLIERDSTPPKIHDLAELHRLLIRACPDWDWDLGELHYLSRAAVEFRYPGESADHEDAAQSMAICERLRIALMRHLQRSEPGG
ncbi:MAG: HEPN domain-containing protein [Lentisphaeria bacterium]|nr:HEPN domain-containing protein [Lentisphaeria bacterium]